MVELIPHKRLQKLVGIVDTMADKSAEIFSEKKNGLASGDEAVLQQVGEGKDIMSILSASITFCGARITQMFIVKANMEVKDEDKLPERELIAQMS